MAKVKGIQIEGLNELMRAFDNMPKQVGPAVIQNIARKPALKVVSETRKIFPFEKTGMTKRTFAILRIKNKLQTFLEVGVKGRSLAYIFMGGAWNRERENGGSTGDIKPIGNIIEDAAGNVSSGVLKEMSINIEKIIARTIKRFARR